MRNCKIGGSTIRANYAIKSFIAFVVVFVFFNLICQIYYHMPAWYDRSSNATSYIWRPNSYILQAKEGFGFNTIDENGYVNPIKPLVKKDYILVFGASHSQGKEINQGERYTDLLNSRYGEEELKVYNLSGDGHFYDKIVAGFSAGIEEFPDSSAAIIEIGTTEYDVKTLEEALSQRNYNVKETGEYIKNSVDQKTIIKQTVKETMPYVALLKHRVGDGSLDFGNPFGLNDKVEEENSNVFDKQDYYDLVKLTANSLKNNYSGKIIICYHPGCKLSSDGTVDWKEEETYKPFRQAIEDSGIYFLDMTDAFDKLYEEEKILPYGFQNTTFGGGHLNQYGHKLLAEKLFDVLEECK